jgi:hypothetical protein
MGADKIAVQTARSRYPGVEALGVVGWLSITFVLRSIPPPEVEHGENRTKLEGLMWEADRNQSPEQLGTRRKRVTVTLQGPRVCPGTLPLSADDVVASGKMVDQSTACQSAAQLVGRDDGPLHVGGR